MTSQFKRKRQGSLIKAAIAAKGPAYSEASARALESDALAILEALLAEADEASVTAALDRQGFRSSNSYLTTFRALKDVAVSRRRPNETAE